MIQLDFTPRKHQREAHNARKRFTVLVWHRRAGKSVFSIIELILAALCCVLPLGEYAYIAPTQKQAKRVAWRYLKFFCKVIPGWEKNESELWIRFPNGARIQIMGADNPDGLRGAYLDGVILDEVAQMKPQVWGEVMRPMLSDRHIMNPAHGWAIVIGTPKGINLFSELYYRAIDDEDWHTNVLRASTSGVFSEEERAAMEKEMSPAEYAQEMECDFGASAENTLLLLNEVLESQKRHLHESQYNFAARIMGVDVARYGKDKSVILARQGLQCFNPRLISGMDTMTLAGAVASAIDKFEPDACFVDGGGIGGGVIDRLRQLGYVIIEVQFGGRPNDERNENKRAEMWRDMAEWVKQGGALPPDSRLITELTAPQYTYKNVRGRFQLESKEDMRKRGLPSPDIADALALTFAHPVAPRPAWAKLPGAKPHTGVVSGFDPFRKSA